VSRFSPAFPTLFPNTSATLTAHSPRPSNSGPSAVSRKPMADPNGQVYEQFLGKVIRLTAGHQAKVKDKREGVAAMTYDIALGILQVSGHSQ